MLAGIGRRVYPGRAHDPEKLPCRSPEDLTGRAVPWVRECALCAPPRFLLGAQVRRPDWEPDQDHLPAATAQVLHGRVGAMLRRLVQDGGDLAELAAQLGGGKRHDTNF